MRIRTPGPRCLTLNSRLSTLNFSIPITDSFDLHSFRPRDLPDVLGGYLEEAAARGFREVRVIHGKGTGTRRAQVRRLLSEDRRVAEFFDAPPERGGLGATVVILKPRLES